METRYISLNEAIDMAKFYEAECDPIPRLIDSLNAIQPADVVPAPRWISVEERLPENGTRCLVVRYDYVTDTPFVDMLWFDNSWWNRINSGDYAVTHWMPLPQPPKEGGGTLES